MKLEARVGGRVHAIEIDGVEDETSQASVRVDGVVERVDLRALDAGAWSLLVGARSWELAIEQKGDVFRVVRVGAIAHVRITEAGTTAHPGQEIGGGPEQISSIMPGKVVRVLVEEGQAVVVDQGLLVVEAMKMENEIVSPRAGRVSVVRVAPGQTVESGAILLEIE